MSIPVGVRNVPETPSNTRCETVDACRLLCEHVLRITQFKRFTDVVASEDIRLYVRQLAVDAFISAQVANEQRADKDHLDHGNTWHLQQRLNRYQNELWRNK